MLNYAFGSTAEEGMGETGSAMGWHDNQVRGDFLREPTGLVVDGRAFAEVDGTGGRQVVFPRHFLQPFAQG